MAETIARYPDAHASRYVPPHRRPRNPNASALTRHEKEKEEQALLAQVNRLEAERNVILGRLDLLQAPPKTTPQERVIAFVHTIEHAHDYFAFKDFLAEECTQCRVVKNDLDVDIRAPPLPKIMTMFNMLSQQDINQAILAHEWYVRAKLLYDPDGILYRNLPTEDSDTYAFSNPIFGFVFQVRKGVYVMDKDPEKELQKIKDSVNNFSDRFIFTWRYLLQKTEAKKNVARMNGSMSGAKNTSDVTSKLPEAYKKYSTLRCQSKEQSKNAKAASDSGILVTSEIA